MNAHNKYPKQAQNYIHYSQMYSYRGFSRHLHSGRCCPIKPANKESQRVTWVNRRYNPNDLRPNTPVIPYPLKSDRWTLDKVPEGWFKPRGPSARDVFRGKTEIDSLTSQPATRDENWSSLREMVPTTGRPYRHRPPSWGVSADVPPELVTDGYERYPKIFSAMSRHRNDQQFSYHDVSAVGLRPVKLALSVVRGGAF